MRLVPRDDGRLGLKYRWLGLIPVSLDELDDVGLTHKIVSGRELLTAQIGDREIYAGEKIHPVSLPAVWRQRAGNYRITNPGKDVVLLKDFKLVIDNELLVLEYATTLTEDYTVRQALIPISDKEVIVHGLSSGEGETIRVLKTNHGELLRYSGYLLRKQESN